MSLSCSTRFASQGDDVAPVNGRDVVPSPTVGSTIGGSDLDATSQVIEELLSTLAPDPPRQWPDLLNDECVVAASPQVEATVAIQNFLDSVASNSPLDPRYRDLMGDDSEPSDVNIQRFITHGYRAVTTDVVERCVIAVHVDAGMVSLDAVAAAVVDGEWQVIRWQRANIREAEGHSSVVVAFVQPGSECGQAELIFETVVTPFETNTPALVAWHAWLEAASGPVGRSVGITAIPTNWISVMAHPIRDRVAFVDLSVGDSALSECQLRDAIAQITYSIFASTDARDVVKVQVQLDGEVVQHSRQ